MNNPIIKNTPQPGAAALIPNAPHGRDTGDSVHSLPRAAFGATAMATPGSPPPPQTPGQAGKEAPPPGEPPAPDPDETLRLANRRLLEAVVRQQAAEAGISARGAVAALQLCSFAPCLVNGAPDEALVQGRLAAFAADWPEFAPTPAPPPFAAGTGTAPLRTDTLKSVLGVL